MQSLLDWQHHITEIPEDGLKVERTAPPAVRDAIAADLKLVAVDKLFARYEIRAARRGRYIVEGAIDARITQSCVVSLDPVEAVIRERFSVEFWPPEQIADDASEEQSALAAIEAEPIEGQRLHVGRVVLETLAVAIDPYPRKPGEQLEIDTTAADAATAKPNPFAVLAKLKPGNEK